jgi:hypothetical protein
MKYLLHDYVEFWHGQVKRKGTITACFPNSDTYNIVPEGVNTKSLYQSIK